MCHWSWLAPPDTQLVGPRYSSKSVEPVSCSDYPESRGESFTPSRRSSRTGRASSSGSRSRRTRGRSPSGRSRRRRSRGRRSGRHPNGKLCHYPTQVVPGGPKKRGVAYDGEVTTDGARGRGEGVGGTEDGTAGLDDVAALPDHGADGAAAHVCGREKRRSAVGTKDIEGHVWNWGRMWEGGG
jgi:hypothetical protein